MDFTIEKYKELLNVLIQKEYHFQTFAEYIEKPEKKVVILRHDVDDKKLNSLAFAKIQADFGIKGSYYFRMVPQSYDKNVIMEIADLGHEIGYHYEDMDFAYQKIKNKQRNIKEEDLYDIAFEIFRKNLALLKEVYPIKTICMHGSPRSSFDNKAIWNKYNYRDLEIIGEPYYDVDFNKVFYLTDTGRRWDGYKVSLRDKVNSQKEWISRGLSFHRTSDIIKALSKEKIPDQIMITFHPQRWTNKLFPWIKELVFQSSKNVIKRMMVLNNQKVFF